MKKILSLLLLGITAASLYGCQDTSVFNPDDYEILYLHNTIESAEVMADNFNLELLNYSEYGVTTYATKSEKQYNSLLTTMGFAPNGYYESAETNDEYTADQFNLDMIGAPNVWSITTGSPDVVVAIIDTGVDVDHPELLSSMATSGFNARTDEVGLEYANDDQGHGTRVAGIIAADKDNTIGIAGIAPDVTIYPIKANYAGTSSFRDSYVINGILHAIDMGVDVINLSLGNTKYNALMEQAVNQATEAGIVVVAAAGNSGTNVLYYPAAYPSVISVGSIEDELTISGFSTYNEHVDIVAPGNGIVSTSHYGDYAVSSGTSFSTPQVAAAVALLLSVYPDMTVDEVKETLYASSIDAGEAGWDMYFGHGMLNIYSALASDLVTVSFNMNGGTIMAPVQLLPGETLTIETEPLKEHHDFAGWYTDSGYTNEWINGSAVDNSMILYARWTPTTYTINFYDNELVDSVDVVYGDSIPAPILVKTGYEFAGWYTYKNDLYDINSTPTSDVDLYAQWTVNTYSIVYLDANGDVYATYEYAYGDTVSHEHPSGPEKQHYDFVGWVGTLPETMPAETITLTPEWTPTIYTVNFYDNGAVISSIDVVYGDTITVPVVAREGYTFSGWYLNGNLYDVNNTPESDMDLYSEWSVNTYTITYLDANGDVYATYEYAYGDTISHTHPDGPIKEYYDFVGWVGTLPETMPAGNITLTPEYSKRIGVIYVTITITVVYEDGTEEIITIEVPQDQVDDIINQYT